MTPEQVRQACAEIAARQCSLYQMYAEREYNKEMHNLHRDRADTCNDIEQQIRSLNIDK